MRKVTRWAALPLLAAALAIPADGVQAQEYVYVAIQG